jgi:hypothetical protein
MEVVLHGVAATLVNEREITICCRAGYTREHDAALMGHHLLCHVRVKAALNVAKLPTGTAKGLENAVLLRAEACLKWAVDILTNSERFGSPSVSTSHGSKCHIA